MDENRDESTPLGESVDLEQWEPQLPPSDFADRVLARVRESEGVDVAGDVRAAPSRSRARRWGAVTGGVAALALAAAVLLRVSGPASHGEAIAKERIEVAIGARALAVLEAGADVRWNGDDVVQSGGDVFYRVEPGARFTVHTPAGDVEVKGTCFAVKVRALGAEREGERTDMQKRDMKAGAVGAAISALALVVVYEGKVAVSHASDRIELRAGEAAQTGPDGVKRAGVNGEDFDRDVAALQVGDDPMSRANQNLVRQVGEYRTRLDALAKEKTELEKKLKKSEDHLAATQDGAPYVMKHDFDLSPDDWKELAKDGTVKYQLPCIGTKNDAWSPSAEKLNALGLAPQDGKVLTDAYARSSQRLWGVIQPLCAASVGSPEVANRLGPGTCIHVVLDTENDRDRDATQRARRELGEIRAGMRRMPGPDEAMNPVLKMFLATTGASKSLEDDLAQSFGPEEAHRVVYSNELCMGSHEFGGSAKKK